jgi:hypothetical protein
MAGGEIATYGDEAYVFDGCWRASPRTAADVEARARRVEALATSKL